ncbi:uncharacterized protein [Hetaerina americana]|uniref:uncharacterized protein isoform X2 n=1 Tax=Hetaerina americana TaxID=62018 RepID=UPI003A7F4ABB
MVTPLRLVFPLVLMTVAKFVSGFESLQFPESLEELKESSLIESCQEFCYLDVGAELKKSYSSKLKGCTIHGGYDYCSTKRIHQFTWRCMDSAFYSEYAGMESYNNGGQTNCSLVCLMSSLPCSMDCDCIYNAANRKRSMHSANRKRDLALQQPWHITDVKLHCQDVKLVKQEVIAYVSWTIGSTLFSEIGPTNPYGMFPQRYAVQIQLENSDIWKEVGETNMTIIKIDQLSPNVSFQVRVRGLDSAGGKIGEDAVSPWIRTTEAHQKPKAVKKIWVDKIFPRRVRGKKQGKYPKYEWKLSVALSWEPSEDILCSYDLAWFYPRGDDMKEIRLPSANFQALLKEIQYSTTYSLKIVAVYPQRDKDEKLEGESEATFLKFNTSSCREMWNNSLILCPPPAPENIKYELIPKGDENGLSIYDLKIFWSLPHYVTMSNEQMTFTFNVTQQGTSQISAYDNSTAHNNSLIGALKEYNLIKEFGIHECQVSADGYEITIPSIVLTSRLTVTMTFESVGGATQMVFYIDYPESHTTPKRDMAAVDSKNEKLIAAVIFVTLLTMILFLLFVVIKKRRKQRCDKKTKYFEADSRVKSGEDDEDGGMLPELTLSSHLEVTSSDPNAETDDENEVDEYEISLNQLVIRELLGEGAFGVVYKGYYKSNNHLSIVDKRNFANLSGPLPSSWEAVAVKMLRVGASVEEEKQLIHEMETLKFLGKSSHPNVVSLIGCHTRKIKNKTPVLNLSLPPDIPESNFCTSKPLLLLIVEHCALGDLHNFLQKVWQESGPLGFMKGQSNIDVSEEKLDQIIEQNEMKCINGIYENKDCQRPLKYAILNHSSSSKEDVNFKCNSIVVTNHSYGIPPDLNDNSPDCGESIDAKDLTPAYLLSYARQIVMGMEFLAGHKVVHRDLAARNILLCGDGCTVKISDFGMSRDVYLQNVYHKSSAHGKLPIKWIAPEALLHRIYTTYSDVYKLMCWCWQERPSDRPSFPELRSHFENLLEQNSASTYLTLPNYAVNMDSNQLDSQLSSDCENNDISKDFESRVSLTVHHSQETFHENNEQPIKKSLSNPTIRDEENESDSDRMPFQKNISAGKTTDHHKNISGCLDG